MAGTTANKITTELIVVVVVVDRDSGFYASRGWRYLLLVAFLY